MQAGNFAATGLRGSAKEELRKMNIKLVDQLHVQNELGEGVLWDHHRQRIWWTDIEQRRLYRYDPVGKELESWATPERLACFAPVYGEDFLVAAFASGFAFYQPETEHVRWIRKTDSDNPGTRLNDGRTDRQGRFWAGGMVEEPGSAKRQGQLFCLHADLTVSAPLSGISISNSLCWSPDSKTMYHCDSPRRSIQQYTFEPASGRFANASEFTQTNAGCFPDGSIVDACGYIWNAQWGGSRVVRYAPDGCEDIVFSMPTSQTSCVAFAGPNLDLLVVTSAWQGMDDRTRADDPKAGDLFIYQTEYRGLAESAFKPDQAALNEYRIP